MSKLLKISKDVSLPLDVITERLAFVGQSGSGKTYAAQRLAELILEHEAQVVALDPQGVWWGLLSTADGKKASGYPVHVFGGRHAHVPIVPGAGARIAEVIFERAISAVIDISLFTMGDQIMFASAFAERFFELQAGSPRPVHLFLEEAHTFMPQNLPPDGRGGDPMRSAAVMLNRFERIARQGRSQGIGCSMISQQPQAVNKKALNQASTLFAMRTLGKHERKAIGEWMADKATDESQLGLDQKLSQLETGEAWIASPHFLKTFQLTRVTAKTTFDSSATPKFGEKPITPKALTPVDVEALRAAMADLVEQAERDSPKALKKRIAELEAAGWKKAPPLPPLKPAPVKRIEVPVFSKRELKAITKLTEELGGFYERLSPLRISVTDLFERVKALQREVSAPNRYGGGVRAVTESASHRIDRQVDAKSMAEALAEARVKMTRANVPRRLPAMGGALPASGGARRMLEAIAAVHPEPIQRRRLALMIATPVKGGSFRTWLPKLRTLGLVSTAGDAVSLTEAGVLEAGDAVNSGPKSRDEQISHWRTKLGNGGAVRMLDVLLTFPDGVRRDALANRLGFPDATHGSFRTWLPKLRTLGIVETEGDLVQLATSLRAA